MKVSLNLTIKKRTQPSWLVLFLVVFPFLFGTLDALGIPRTSRYLMDVAWLFLTLYMLRFRRSVSLKFVNNLVGWSVLFFVYTFLVYIVQYQSPLYYLWGLRNNFRFYAAFFAFVFFMTAKDVETCFGMLDKIFWVNALVSVVQYFALGFHGDYLGGIFGTEAGSNGYTNIFFVTMVAKSMLSYMEGEEGTWSCLIKCAAALLICALAELKFFFLEFILIIVLASLYTKFSWRNVMIIFCGAAGIAVCAELLISLFPVFRGWFSLEGILGIAANVNGYTGSGDLSRLRAISQSNDLWLTKLPEQLFGLGLGNCDTANFAVVNTPFYESYGAYHYTWISYAFMYLECGWVGLILYIGFFALAYFGACRAEKRCMGNAGTYCRLAKIMAICCVLIAVYNSSLRTEAGYLAYFVLALPFTLERSSQRRKQV